MKKRRRERAKRRFDRRLVSRTLGSNHYTYHKPCLFMSDSSSISFCWSSLQHLSFFLFIIGYLLHMESSPFHFSSSSFFCNSFLYYSSFMFFMFFLSYNLFSFFFFFSSQLFLGSRIIVTVLQLLPESFNRSTNVIIFLVKVHHQSSVDQSYKPIIQKSKEREQEGREDESWMKRVMVGEWGLDSWEDLTQEREGWKRKRRVVKVYNQKDKESRKQRKSYEY